MAEWCTLEGVWDGVPGGKVSLGDVGYDPSDGVQAEVEAS